MNNSSTEIKEKIENVNPMNTDEPNLDKFIDTEIKKREILNETINLTETKPELPSYDAQQVQGISVEMFHKLDMLTVKTR